MITKIRRYFRIDEKESSFTLESIAGVHAFLMTMYVMVMIPNIVVSHSKYIDGM